MKWYRKAAEQGLLKAQYALGVLYQDGLGVPQDFVEAHKWLNLAASRSTKSKLVAVLRDQAIILRGTLAEKMTPPR